MESVINSQWFHVILLLTIIGEIFLPWILGRYYTGYNSKMMVMSALGSPKSPVRLIYNMWLIWLGGFLTFTAYVYFAAIKTKFPALSCRLFSLPALLWAIRSNFKTQFCGMRDCGSGWFCFVCMFLLFIRLCIVWWVERRRNEKDYNCGGAVISGTWLLGEMGLQYPQEVAYNHSDFSGILRDLLGNPVPNSQGD